MQGFGSCSYTDVWEVGATLYEGTGEPACEAGDEPSTTHARVIPCRIEVIRCSRRVPVDLACAITAPAPIPRNL